MRTIVSTGKPTGALLWTGDVTINVRDTHGTYIARAAGMATSASCTQGPLHAAQNCADKVYGVGHWKITEATRYTYFASPKDGGAE